MQCTGNSWNLWWMHPELLCHAATLFVDDDAVVVGVQVEVSVEVSVEMGTPPSNPIYSNYQRKTSKILTNAKSPLDYKPTSGSLQETIALTICKPSTNTLPTNCKTNY
eukprot:gene11115-3177_t